MIWPPVIGNREPHNVFPAVRKHIVNDCISLSLRIPKLCPIACLSLPAEAVFSLQNSHSLSLAQEYPQPTIGQDAKHVLTFPPDHLVFLPVQI